MIRRKESFLFRPLVRQGLLVLGLVMLLGCQPAQKVSDYSSTATAFPSNTATVTTALLPTEIITPTNTATATIIPTELSTLAVTPKARIPIRNVLIEGSSTVRNINEDVLGGKELNCSVIPPYCLTARGAGGLRTSQVGDMVKKTADLDNYQALVLYDPQNSMTLDFLTGEQTYKQHRQTVDWVNVNHPDLLVVSGTALDTMMEDKKGRVQKERDIYNNLLIGSNGWGEIVFDSRNALRRNGQPDKDCFSNGEQLHINDICQKRMLGVLKKTLDWWQSLELTLPVNQKLPLPPQS